MKKIFALILVLIALVSLTSCGNNDNETPDDMADIFTSDAEDKTMGNDDQSTGIAEDIAVNDSGGTNGNTSGNIINSGIAAYSDGWIYYRNAADNYSLYRMLEDDSQKTKIADRGVTYINALDDWIYFCSNEGICKIETSGQNLALLSENHALYLNVSDGWIYYCNNSDNRSLSKMRTDGSEHVVLTNDQTTDVSVAGDWVYYSNLDDGNCIYRIRTDGSARTKLTDVAAGYVSVLNGWIYYVSQSGGNIYKMRTDGTDNTSLNAKGWYLNPTDEWLYYCDMGGSGNIFKMRLDGTDATDLGVQMSAQINIAGEWVYYTKATDGVVSMYRVRTDGSDNQQIS